MLAGKPNSTLLFVAPTASSVCAPVIVGNEKTCFQSGYHGNFVAERPVKQKKNVLIVDIADESTEPPDGNEECVIINIWQVLRRGHSSFLQIQL